MRYIVLTPQGVGEGSGGTVGVAAARGCWYSCKVLRATTSTAVVVVVYGGWIVGWVGVSGRGANGAHAAVPVGVRSHLCERW